MKTTSSSARQAAAAPLTHRQCIAAGQALQRRGDRDPRPWVQVRRFDRNGPYVLCARVLELGGSGVELFKVRTETEGPTWVESRNVRLCSGDGGCACEAAAEFNRHPMESRGSTLARPIGASIGPFNRQTGSTGQINREAAC